MSESLSCVFTVFVFWQRIASTDLGNLAFRSLIITGETDQPKVILGFITFYSCIPLKIPSKCPIHAYDTT